MAYSRRYVAGSGLGIPASKPVSQRQNYGLSFPSLPWYQQYSVVLLVSHRPGSTWLIPTPSQLEPYHEAAGVCLCRFYLAYFDQIFKQHTVLKKKKKTFQERLKHLRDPQAMLLLDLMVCSRRIVAVLLWFCRPLLPCPLLVFPVVCGFVSSLLCLCDQRFACCGCCCCCSCRLVSYLGSMPVRLGSRTGLQPRAIEGSN